MKLKTCPSCGKKVLDIAKICKHCNHSFAEPSTPEQPETKPAPQPEPIPAPISKPLFEPKPAPKLDRPEPKPVTPPQKPSAPKWLFAGIGYVIAAVCVWLIISAIGGSSKQPQEKVENCHNGYEWVDLGLSVNWATCNLGADEPWECGDYFSWGEPKAKKEFSIENCTTHDKKIPNISGDPRYDAARAQWGGKWRIPTKEELQELYGECSWQWSMQRGQYGYVVTGPNGRSIFLPAAGFHMSNWIDMKDELANYWGSEPIAKMGAAVLGFTKEQIMVDWSQDRVIGRPIRAVADK